MIVAFVVPEEAPFSVLSEKLVLFLTMSQTTIPLPATAVDEYENILKVVLNDDGTLQESLGHFGVLNLYAFLSLTPGEIDLLTKPPPTERSPSGVTTRSSVAAQTTPSAPIRIPLSLAERSLLKAFKGYVWWYQLEHDGGLPTFMSIERSEFDAFRISIHWNPDILFSRSLPKLKYEQYKSLLLSAAAAYHTNGE